VVPALQSGRGPQKARAALQYLANRLNPGVRS
jgi:hypothetical protein